MDAHKAPPKAPGRTPSDSASSYEEIERTDTTSSQISRRSSRRADSFAFPESESAALEKLASRLHEAQSQGDGSLRRLDTVSGLDRDATVLDPLNSDFDMSKFLRFVMRSLDKEDIKQRKTGVAFRNLSVSGNGESLSYQSTIGGILTSPLRIASAWRKKSPSKLILDRFDGLLLPGEMLIVLGRPGSGCSTLLKSISGQVKGLDLHDDTHLVYDGISRETMAKQFRGEVVYNQEVDTHFPHLTVQQTIDFAASARAPSKRLFGTSRKEFTAWIRDVVLTIYGLSHTKNTKVGDNFVRGVSGGERKRVSIAEMTVARAPLGCWDNSTRGLDSASAREFTHSLRLSADIGQSSHVVAIYQASQDIYEEFDRVCVLYTGKQIYYGPTDSAKQYFEDMGYECPPRQTTGDFLTSITNPAERKIKSGFEDKVPKTAEEFAQRWKDSEEHRLLLAEIQAYETKHGEGEEKYKEFQESRDQEQSKRARQKSSYTLSLPKQAGICVKRAFQRVWGDKVGTVTTVGSNIIMAFIIGSIYYGTPASTAAFFAKGGVLFFAVLLSALSAITEINLLYAQRPIVEKQNSFAFYHPFIEALAGLLSNLPVKIVQIACFDIVIYFLAGLRTEASAFFVFFLFTLLSSLVMSCMFRSLAVVTKTLSQALAMAGVLVLVIVIYTGFMIPTTYQKPWFSWLRYLNPIAYSFEAMIVNEFHGRQFACADFVPAFPGASGVNRVCNVRGAVAGSDTVSGDAFLQVSYQYSYSHIWRNLGILLAFYIGFLAIYLVASEYNSSPPSKAEAIVFRRGKAPKALAAIHEGKADEEATGKAVVEETDPTQTDISGLSTSEDVFTWRNVNYDIPIKGETRRLLNDVSGWVKPGQLTALMGVSGAGKTTLLDALAQRLSIGVITGDMLVNGKPLDASFQRRTGYVQQQDLHLETSTVREALRFSALLRRPKTVSKKEKYDFVEEVIGILGMEEYADGVVGSIGEGLNVEQRKLLSIGVELVAKPSLLLFLDEPSSGLDSQSAWSIVAFIKRLASHGQAVLCTIHQPSAILFQEFDRLLLLAKGGKTCYFGEIGEQSKVLLEYLERNGASKIGKDANPAEHMLDVIGAGASGKSQQDWPNVWLNSPEYQAVQEELDKIEGKARDAHPEEPKASEKTEFAMPLWVQIQATTYRVFQQYWRSPNYIIGKLMLGITSSLFISFSFYKPNSSMQGMQNTLFAIFLLMTLFTTLVQQIMPMFISQRELYEVRERPSKAYSWVAFLFAQIFVEIPWQSFLAVIVFASWYYPVGFFEYAAPETNERAGLIFLYVLAFFIMTSTFAHMVIAALPDTETAGAVATLMFSLSLTFNGVFQPPSALPGFWIFMYRVSPFTYLVSGIAATGLHARKVQCADAELAKFQPPQGQTCGQYMEPYLSKGMGYLTDQNSSSNCEYCSLSVADTYLAGSQIFWGQRWRNLGITCAYIGINIFFCILLYYLVRVKVWKKKGGKSSKKGGKSEKKGEKKAANSDEELGVSQTPSPQQ